MRANKEEQLNIHVLNLNEFYFAESEVKERRGSKEEREPESLVSAEFDERLSRILTHRHTHPQCVLSSASLQLMYRKVSGCLG